MTYKGFYGRCVNRATNYAYRERFIVPESMIDVPYCLLYAAALVQKQLDEGRKYNVCAGDVVLRAYRNARRIMDAESLLR